MADARTLILCGGKGTRAYPLTVDVPKPLLPIAGRPILAHVMEVYARQGFTDFLLAGGYRVECLHEFGAQTDPDWTVAVRDTGLDTNTGARVFACRDEVGPTFMVTYGDGIGDVDISALFAFHHSHAGAATLTSVPLRSQYGVLDIDDDERITGFREKPILRDHWINAGFFVFDDRVFEMWDGDDLEREVLPALAAQGELYVFRHDGFWKSMDTQKEMAEVTTMIERGHIPWRA